MSKHQITFSGLIKVVNLLQAIECYICKKAGHLCCFEKKGEGPTVASCYRCGEYGHFAPVRLIDLKTYSSSSNFSLPGFMLVYLGMYKIECGYL